MLLNGTGSLSLQKRLGKTLHSDHYDGCIHFLQHFCIFLQPMRIFAKKNPKFLHLFLS